MVFSLIKKKIWSDGSGAVGTSGGQKSMSTVLVCLLQDHKWTAAVRRVSSHPSEAKTWAKVELNNVGTTNLDTNTIAGSGNDRRRSSVVSAAAVSPQPQQNSRDDSAQGSSRRRDSSATATTNNNNNSNSKTNSAKCKVLPLHVALIQGAPLEVIQALLKANSEGIIARDGRYNRYPLHFACLYHPRLEVIEYLISKDKSSCRHRDVLNRTALHYAAFGKAPVEVFDSLLQQYPDSVKIQDMLQWLPLHVAARMSCSFDVLKRLVEVYPSALTKETRRGSTPVDIATRFFGASSIMESQLCCLQAAVETIYDTQNSRLSLAMMSGDYWETDGPLSNSSNNTDDNDVPAANDGLDQEDAQAEQEQDGDDVEASGRFEGLPGLRSSECSSICEEEELNIAATASAVLVSPDPDNSCDPDSNMCVVCLEEERTHAFVPCGHLCVCVECSVLSHRQAGGIKCPLCRKKSYLVMKVFA